VLKSPLTILLLIAFVVPLAASQGDQDQIRADILKREGQPITFYGHTFGWGRTTPMPMNTQFPAGEADYSIGTSTQCGNPPPLPADNQACRTAASNEAYWYSTAGFVQVKSSDEWGVDYRKFHNERGLTQDVYLDTSKPAQATMYMSADFHGWLVALCVAVCWNWDPGYYQDWVVEATIWHAPLGDLHSNPETRPDMGKVVSRAADVVKVANGVSKPITMMSFDETIPVIGAKTVYEFTFPFNWDPGFVAKGGVIPRTDNIIVEWEWYQLSDNPTGGKNMYILGTGAAGLVWNQNSGEDYPSNIIIPVRNPLDVELVYPQFIHEKLVILSIINTPWGSYDVAPETIKVTIRDDKGNIVPIKPGTLTEVLEQSVAHSGHYQPIKPTWVWDYKAQGLKPGSYTVSVGVENFQRSVAKETTAAFTLLASGAGTTKEGRSGFQTNVGDIHAGHQGTAADPNAAPASGPTVDNATSSPSKDAPLWGSLAAASVAVAFLLRRRQQQ
jgi:hypothetical protein